MGVIGTGDEGSVLIGASNPKYIAVRRSPTSAPTTSTGRFTAITSPRRKTRPGLVAVYKWKTEDAARKEVKVYGDYKELIAHAKDDKLEAVIIALPLHLHAPVAIAAMRAGPARHHREAHGPQRLPVQGDGPDGQADRAAAGHRPPAPLQHPLRQRGEIGPPGACWASCTTSAPSGTAAICPATTVGSRRCRRA